MAKADYRVCARCSKNRHQKFYKSTRARVCSFCLKKRVQSSAKDTRLQDTYGISLADYHNIVASQGGVCGICGGRRSVFDVDHDHARERALREAGMADGEAARLSVRGCLCRRCNRRLLTGATDNVAVLRAAIEYLERPPAHSVLWDESASSGDDGTDT